MMITDFSNASDITTAYASADDSATNATTTISDNATDFTDVFGVTTVSSTEGQPLLDRLELCRRLSPPPIPPWLLDAPEKLRLVVTNCSSWQRYIDLCSLQVPPEYPHALAEHPDSGNVAVQWIPFIVVVLMSIFIVLSVIVIYTLYRTKRMKFDFFAEYHKYGHKYQNYCDEGGYMTPSVTVESQLSVCALEDDSYAAIIPSHMVYKDRGQGRANIVRSAGVSTRSAAGSLYDLPRSQSLLSREIILHPDTLSDDDLQTPLYVSDMSGSDYYSSHSLPIDSDSDKISTRSKHKGSEGIVTLHDERHEGDYDSPYVQLHRGKAPKQSFFARISQPDAKSEGVGHNKRGSVKRVVQRCRRAGASLVHGVIWNRNQGQHVNSSERTKMPLSLARLRQSIHNIRTLRNKPCRNSDSLDTEVPTDTTTQLESGPSLSAQGQSDTPTEAQGRDASSADNDRSFLAGSRLKNLGHFLRSGRRSRSKGVQDKNFKQQKLPTNMHNQDQTFTYVNEAFEGHEHEPRQRKSPFRRIRMPTVLRKMGKSK